MRNNNGAYVQLLHGETLPKNVSKNFKNRELFIKLWLYFCPLEFISFELFDCHSVESSFYGKKIICVFKYSAWSVFATNHYRDGFIFNIAGSIIATVYEKRTPFCRLLFFLFFNMITRSIIQKGKYPSFIYSPCSNSVVNGVRRITCP